MSTLWDYINRAMPWNAPKSLKHRRGLRRHGLPAEPGRHRAGRLHAVATRNIAEVQQLLPNRNGMTTDHGLWPGKGMGNGGKPDVKAVACMKQLRHRSHGGLVPARLRPQRARQPGRAEPPGRRAARRRHHAAGAGSRRRGRRRPPRRRRRAADGRGRRRWRWPASTAALACHGIDNKLVGPGFREIAEEVRRPRRRRRLPGRQDPCRRQRRLGPDPDAAADPAATPTPRPWRSGSPTARRSEQRSPQVRTTSSPVSRIG